jgi:hypothetical protein
MQNHFKTLVLTWHPEFAQKINHRGKFTPEFRSEHKTAPEMVPWIAGLVKAPATKSS